MQQRNFVDRLVHDEADRAAHRTGQYQGIDVADVVAGDDCRSLCRNLFQALVLHPIQGVGQQPDQQAHGEFRHLAEHKYRHRRIHQCHDHEELWDGEVQHGEKHDTQQCGDHHKQRVEDIGYGDDPRAQLLIGAVLNHRVQRHDIQAAEDADQRQVQQERLCAGAGPEGGERNFTQWVKVAADDRQGDAAVSQAGSAQRYQAQFDAAAGQALTEQ